MRRHENYTVDDAEEAPVLWTDENEVSQLAGYRFFGTMHGAQVARYRAEQRSVLEAFGLVVSKQWQKRRSLRVSVAQISSPDVSHEDRDMTLDLIGESRIKLVAGPAHYRLHQRPSE